MACASDDGGVGVCVGVSWSRRLVIHGESGRGRSARLSSTPRGMGTEGEGMLVDVRGNLLVVVLLVPVLLRLQLLPPRLRLGPAPEGIRARTVAAVARAVVVAVVDRATRAFVNNNDRRSVSPIRLFFTRTSRLMKSWNRRTRTSKASLAHGLGALPMRDCLLRPGIPRKRGGRDKTPLGRCDRGLSGGFVARFKGRQRRASSRRLEREG